MGLYSSPQKSTLGLEFELIFPHKKKKKETCTTTQPLHMFQVWCVLSGTP